MQYSGWAVIRKSEQQQQGQTVDYKGFAGDCASVSQRLGDRKGCTWLPALLHDHSSQELQGRSTSGC